LGIEQCKSEELADLLSMAFLVMLERRALIERAVFLLREVFEYDYPEIAQIVGKSAENCWHLRRARQHLATECSYFPVTCQQQEQIIKGQPGVLFRTESNIQSVMTFEIVENYIQTIYSIRNPEKLKQLSESANME
jgi:RNA polymerase sigma-70 factor, ECF subfamily